MGKRRKGDGRRWAIGARALERPKDAWAALKGLRVRTIRLRRSVQVMRAFGARATVSVMA